MKIGEKTIRKGGDMLTNSMLSYISKINEAFNNNGEEDLKIGLSLTIKPGQGTGNFKLQSDINFTTEKIKDTFTDSCDEAQGALDLEGKMGAGTGELKKCPNRPPKDRVYASYCNNNCPDRLIKIFVSHKSDPQIITADNPADMEKGDFIQHRSCSSWSDDDTKENIRAMLEKIDVEIASKKDPVTEGVLLQIPGAKKKKKAA